MYRSTVICLGLLESEVVDAVSDLLSEFAERTWQETVTCEWRDGVLRLSAQNDSDDTGMGLLDEFWDAVHAYINYSHPIRVQVESVVEI